MSELTSDMIGLFMKRAYDIAGTTPGVKVFLNGTKIGFNSKTPFRDYCKLYVEDKIMDNGTPYQLVYEKCSNPQAKDRWEVGFAISDQGLNNVSFVNSINTIKGGRHVDVVLEQIVKKLEEKVNAKNKGKHDHEFDRCSTHRVTFRWSKSEVASDQVALLDICKCSN